MKRNKIIWVSSVLFLLILLLAVLIYWFRGEIKKRMLPTVKPLSDISIIIKNDTAYIATQLTITNRTFIKIKADTIKYKVMLLNKTYLQSERYLGLNLPANGSDTIDFAIKIPYVDVIKDFKNQRKNGDSSSYSVNVSLQYTTLFGNSEALVNRTAKFKLPQPPDLEIKRIKYKKIRLKYILAEAEIKVFNHNTVALAIRNMKYNIEVSKHGNIKGNYGNTINIKPQGETIITLPIEIKMKHVGKIIRDVITNNDVYDYKLTLDADLDAINPVKQSFHIALTKSGKMELNKK